MNLTEKDIKDIALNVSKSSTKNDFHNLLIYEFDKNDKLVTRATIGAKMTLENKNLDIDKQKLIVSYYIKAMKKSIKDLEEAQRQYRAHGAKLIK